MSGYRLLQTRVRIPVPGGKLIEEIAGRASTGHDAFSLAHMVAPPGWGEEPQTPEFGELTVMVRGRMRVEVGGDTLEVAAPQSIWIEPGVPVRYSNPFAEESEYFALCVPAFTVERARR